MSKNSSNPKKVSQEVISKGVPGDSGSRPVKKDVTISNRGEVRRGIGNDNGDRPRKTKM